MEFTLDGATRMLGRTPQVLRALLTGLGEDWTGRNYGPATWTAFEVVGHLIHGEKTDWIPRARIILEHGPDRPFEPFDRTAHIAPNRGRPLDELLDEFESLRRISLAALHEMRLTSDKLDLRGTHPALGTVTMRELLATWVVHDLNHIAQICKAMGFQYKDQTGPWAQYLSILSPPAPR